MIDFARYSLTALLKMARDADLIDDYECNRDTASIVVAETCHTVSHQTARGFLQSILTEWWHRQQQQYEPPEEISA
ncbi:MAG TPA: hypothetical protein VFG50_14105 [Rhodothermales bacterium]|nr:hypothetical protein [Rhodothermales bacterium]